MSFFLQLGHDSWNLADDTDGGDYVGLVLSPVNDEPSNVLDRLNRLKAWRESKEIILDPQLYNPGVNKGKLNTWGYYSDEFATAEQQDLNWWSTRSEMIVAEAEKMSLDAICSPAIHPKVFSNEYYKFTVDVADSTFKQAQNYGLSSLLTLLVKLGDLQDPNKAFEIASIVTQGSCDRVYLAFYDDDSSVRSPYHEQNSLATAVHLVSLLSESMRVHVAFCSNDLILWKSAGCHDISSGKYFNLREFSPSRWQDEDRDGRNKPYWHDDGLVTLLRDQDVLRLDRDNWFEGTTFSDNPASNKIMEILRAGEGKAWLKLSWLQYLRWASNTEKQVDDAQSAEHILNNADELWGRLEEKRIRLADRYNDGKHIRPWLNAVYEGVNR